MTRKSLNMFGAAACLMTLGACDMQDFAELFPATTTTTATQSAPAPAPTSRRVVQSSAAAPTQASAETQDPLPVNPHLRNNPFANLEDGNSSSSSGSDSGSDGGSSSGGTSSGGSSSGGSSSGGNRGGGWTGG